MQLIHPSEPAGKFPPLCQHSACFGFQTVGNKHGKIGPSAAIRVMKRNPLKRGGIEG